MRIVTKQGFMKLKTPFVFSNYGSCVITELFICTDNTSMKNDFCLVSLISEIKLSDEFPTYHEFLLNAEETGEDFETDFEYIGREGLYDDESLYIVYDKKDLKKLISKLQSVINAI